MLSVRKKFLRRKKRNSNKILLRKNKLPRLSVFRSNEHVYAQIVDDQNRCTLLSASSIEKNIKSKNKLKGQEVATLVGESIAKLAISKGIVQVVFDRGGCLFHGRIKSLADAARANGLKF